jgi:hypothetical protein
MVQSEYYTASKDAGVVEFDRQAVTDEAPSYVVFNGAVGALTGDNALGMARRPLCSPSQSVGRRPLWSRPAEGQLSN